MEERNTMNDSAIQLYGLVGSKDIEDPWSYGWYFKPYWARTEVYFVDNHYVVMYTFGGFHSEEALPPVAVKEDLMEADKVAHDSLKERVISFCRARPINVIDLTKYAEEAGPKIYIGWNHPTEKNE